MNHPQMTAALDTQSIADLVQMSVGTEKGSWFADPAFGSELHTIEKVDGNTAFVVQRMIVQATRWLLDDGLAADITVGAQRLGRNGISWQALITRPEGGGELVEGVWHAV